MRQSLHNRLTKLEAQVKPADPPRIQVIWPDPVGPVVPAPGANWSGLLILRVVRDDPGDGNNETIST